ncbi:MAG: transporter suffix domain-containing protein [Deltaproteobacteria bacterium]|nr:transporter suffix domain-containing protein [Deltaproteobacteria bacterium]
MSAPSPQAAEALASALPAAALPASDLSAAAPVGGWRARLRPFAWASVVLSFPIWGAAFVVVPFLPLGVGEKAALAGACIAAGEVMFWGAGIVLGADLMARIKARLPSLPRWPWFRPAQQGEG